MKVIEWIGKYVSEIVIGIIVIIFTASMALVFMTYFRNENNKISEGVVIDKNYKAPYTTTIYIEVGDTRIPQSTYHPESYSLEIQGEKNEESVTYWFECTAEEYRQYSIGDYYRK